MPEAEQEKSTFDLSGGLNTELHDLAWPDGFTTDEANYELLSDGTRRRRKGLASEAGNTAQAVATISGTQFNQSFKWKNVDGDPDKSFLVHQIGSILYFTDDDEEPSDSWHVDSVDLATFAAETTPTATNISDKAVRFAQGRGHLFITGPYLNPFYIKYAASTNNFTAVAIQINYRDFEGIEDGIAVTALPTDATITADHRYNMRNRGFSDADLTALRAANGNFPGKNALWYNAYERTVDTTGDTTKVPVIGTRELKAAKMKVEVFGSSTAHQGALFLNPFDTRFGASVSGGGLAQPIESWSGTPVGPANFTATINITAHGFATLDNVTIIGNLADYQIFNFPASTFTTIEWTLDGTYPITKITNDQFTISVPHPQGWVGWVDQFRNLGQVGTALALANSDGSLVQRGFEAIAFFAGRVWYAGLADTQFADHIFFSRIIEKPSAYGECHQRQDPTDESFNSLTPADGGVLVVPGLNGVKDMMVIGNSLVVVGTEGAWEIAGARGAVFTATSFGVRQLTTANLNSPTGTIAIDDSGIAVGPSGIYTFAPNEFTRQLEATNMIKDTIQTKWNQYSTAIQQRAQIVYDDAKQRLYIMIGATAADNDYNEMLILDVRKGAWFVYTFLIAGSEKLLTMVAISDADDSSDNQKMKFVFAPTSTTLDIADFQHTAYLDFDGLESPLPFMVSGFDNIGDFQRRKQAPIITVFSKRTETGYTVNGDGGWDADNESSTLMTAFWDWTEPKEWTTPATALVQRDWTGSAGNYGVSGKIGAQSQVYRHTRRFVPILATDVDGYPTVVTRNKVRGRGRVLQLRFDGAATKDSHLIGWTTNYKVSRKK